MNWIWLRHFPWLDTRARFVAAVPRGASLLDLGSSDGETLGHIAELRPDLELYAADKAGQPEKYPAGCQFQRADLERDKLPWPDRSMDGITCMHLIEHLKDLSLLLKESARLLKPGGRIYLETPHKKTLDLPSLRGNASCDFTLNFYDDPTHVRVVQIEELDSQVCGAGLLPLSSGISRNWLFAAAHPLLSWFPDSRKKFTARVHWIGWSAFLIASRPA